MTRRRRGGLLILLAGAVGLAAALVTLRGGAAPPPASVVIARAPLAPGALIDDASAGSVLATVPVPPSLPLAGLVADPADAVGRRVAVPVAPGEPLTQAALGGAPGTGPAPLAVGERAVAVPLSAAGGAAAGVRPGARVDVVASTGEGLAGRTALVVADAEVLGVAPPEGPEASAGPGDVVLRVRARQALRITAALNFAREVRLLVRPPEEVGAAPGPRAVAAP